MTRYATLLTAAISVVLLGACARGEVIVSAELEGETAGSGAAEARPLRDLAIRLIPFDRDLVFDSLEAAHPAPEPAIPEDLLELQEQVAQLQDRWSAAEERWNAVRDSLRRLNDEMERLDRGTARYRFLFNEFNQLSQEERRLNQQREQAFDQFDTLQRDLASRSAELRVARVEWADEAFRVIDSVFAARYEDLGREDFVERIGADGTARFNVPPGRWWVVARYELLYHELYWNIPIEAQRGEPVLVRLSRENATIRPTL